MTGGAIDIQRAIVARISGSLYDFGRRVDAFQEYLDYGSLALDVSIIGSPISWIPDVVNASISTIRGDYFGAGLSAAAILPAVGAPGNLTRIGIREAHHVLPKFLGGLDPQKLANLTPEAHGAFHRILRARLQAHGFDLPIGGTTESSLE